MIGLIQRVSHASVRVDNKSAARSIRVFYCCLAVEPEDSESHAERLLREGAQLSGVFR